MRKAKPEKKKLPLFLRFMVCLLAIIIGVCIAVIILMIGNGSTNTNGNQQEPTDTATITTQVADQLLFDNDFAKVSFNKVFEADGVEGVFYLQLDMENKTDKEVWLYLDSVSVNNEMTTAMSGVPTIITAGKKSANPFIISFSNLSISELSEVKEISFKIVVEDNETSETIAESEEITISL